MQKILLYLLCLGLLSACAAQVVRLPDGTELPAEIYAHQLSVQAYSARAADSGACYRAATSDIGLAVCGLAAGSGGQQAQVPTFQRGPSGVDRFIGITQALTPLVGMGLQAWQSEQQGKRNSELQLGLAAVSATREANIIASIGAMNATGYNALSQTASTGFSALQGTASAGFGSLERTASTGFDSISAIGVAGVNAGANSSVAWANTVAVLPPTYSLGDGSVFGDGNTTLNGGGDIDQSQVGRDRDVSRECTSTAIADSSQTGTTSGTTGPQGAPLGFTQYPGQLDCGG